MVIVKQPGHLTSIKKDRGAGTRVWGRCLFSKLVIAYRGVSLPLVCACEPQLEASD